MEEGPECVSVNNREDGRHERQVQEGQGSRWIVALFPRFLHSAPLRSCSMLTGSVGVRYRTDELDTFIPPSLQ